MKVLIITGKFGMGHYAAALNLAEQVKGSGLAQDVRVSDLCQEAFPNSCELVYSTYSLLMKRGRLIYNSAHNTVGYGERNNQNSNSWIWSHLRKTIAGMVARYQPDVVITTYSIASRAMAEYKRYSGDSIPLVTCITDVSGHNNWLNQETDLYLVAAASTRNELVMRGVDPQKVAVSGIPVRSEFKRGEARIEGQNRRFEVLIMGGGLGLIPAQTAFYDALSRMENIHVTVITAKNEKLRKKLAARHYRNYSLIGLTDQVDAYMRQADLIITKPGGITTFEAIHAEVPMLVFHPFLGQEVRNGQFIEANGFGMVLDKDPHSAVTALRTILSYDELLENIRNNMKNMKARLDDQALLRFLAEYAGKRQGRAIV